ncbi:MAG: anti-sigma factor family protein [Phycisphaerae bacterium]
MNCDDVQRLMADAVGDELAPADEAAFLVHVAGCAACRDAYDRHRGAVAILRRVTGPPRVTSQPRATVVSPERRRGRTRSAHPMATRWTRVLGYAASVVVAFLLGHGIRTGPEHTGIVDNHDADSVPVASAGPATDSATSPSITSTTPPGGAATRAPVGTRRGFRAALAVVHRRHPGRSDLAKGLIALFSK